MLKLYIIIMLKIVQNINFILTKNMPAFYFPPFIYIIYIQIHIYENVFG